MIFHGIDEAALGPRLGPFCAALIRFSTAKEYPPDTDLYELLSPALSRSLPDFHRAYDGRSNCTVIPIMDSKKIYTPARGIALLESVIQVVMESIGLLLPDNLLDLVKSYCPDEDVRYLEQIPWYEHAAEAYLPLSQGSKLSSEGLKQALQQSGFSLSMPEIRLVTARELNVKIIKHGGKSAALRSILRPLMKKACQTEGGCRLSVDRQGGRRYYRDWLCELMPGTAIVRIEESPRRSAYVVPANPDRLLVEFLVSGDSLRLEIALASMFAKYFREVAMHYFNAWWLARVKNLRPTAGYPQDARRFVDDLEKSGNMLKNPNDLIRLS